MRPNINEDGHGKLSKRMTSGSCNMDPVMGISRGWGEILNWECDRKQAESRNHSGREDGFYSKNK